MNIKKSLVLLSFILLLAASFSVLTKVKASVPEVLSSCDYATTPPADQLKGFAWSDNIGWVSFSNTSDGSSVPYGVIRKTDGSLCGFAWSDNLGWLMFDPSFTGPAGATDAFGARIVGTDVRGWARFCSGTVTNDCAGANRVNGFDGWVNLSGGWANGVRIEANRNIIGYAWGSAVTGWLLFYNVCVDCNPTENPLSTNLWVKKTTSSEWVAGNININNTEAVDVRWSSTGMNKVCGLALNGSEVTSYSTGDSEEGTKIGIASLPTGSNVFTYSCRDITTGARSEKTARVQVSGIDTTVNACGGTLPSNAVVCNGDGLGSAYTWRDVGSGGSCTVSTACEYFVPDETLPNPCPGGNCGVQYGTCTPITNATMCSGDDAQVPLGTTSTLVPSAVSCSLASNQLISCQYYCNPGFVRDANNTCVDPRFIER